MDLSEIFLKLEFTDGGNGREGRVGMVEYKKSIIIFLGIKWKWGFLGQNKQNVKNTNNFLMNSVGTYISFNFVRTSFQGLFLRYQYGGFLRVFFSRNSIPEVQIS